MADNVYMRLFFEWDGHCAYCGIELNRVKNFGARKHKRPKGSVDHFIPLSKGGLNHRSNRVLACTPCNCDKGDIDPRDESGEVVHWVHVWQRLQAVAASPMVPVNDVRRLLDERERARREPVAAARPSREDIPATRPGPLRLLRALAAKFFPPSRQP